MSESGKLDKPGSQGVPKTSDPDAAESAVQGVPSWSEIQYRATGGKEGTAPLERLFAGRQAVGANVMQRMAIMRKVGGAADVGGQPKVPEGAGAPLGSDLRAKMESQMGADLSGVRVHTGGESAQAAKGFGARAFTVGNDLHFNAGQFAPGTREGDKLLAHELTHVVQGQKSGIQRKEEPGAKGDAAGGAGAEGGEAEHKVSEPGEAAEVEADAVSEQVAGGPHDKGKGKDKKKDKKDAKGDAGGDSGGDEKETKDDAGGPGGDKAGPAGAAGGAAAKGDSKGDAKGGAAPAAAGEEKAAPGEQKAPKIAAKLEGVGRKVFLAPSGPPPVAPAAPAAAPAKAVDPAKQALIDKAKACKTPGAVDEICKEDPIATQKLSDVKGENNMDGGKNDAAKQGFYQALANWIQSNADTLNPKTIFNQCMNSLAGPWKFQGKKVDVGKLPKAISRTQGLRGFWFTAVDTAYYNNLAVGAPDPAKTAFDLWKQDAVNGKATAHLNGKEIMPTGGTWFTPDSYQLTNGADAGYGQVLELAALQPEWFPDGNICFEVDTATAAKGMEARKPTAYDGMQSALWVSRPGPESYGVTGGGAQEFLAGKVPVNAIKNARAVIPSANTQQELKDAIKAARDLALSQDPDLKKRIEAAPDGTQAKKDLEAMIPNLTDMFLRGQATMPMSASVKQMLGNIKKSTEGERKAPSAERASGEVTAPSTRKT